MGNTPSSSNQNSNNQPFKNNMILAAGSARGTDTVFNFSGDYQ